MSNVYLMTFEPAGVQRDAVLAFMEQNENVADYHASIPTNLLVIVSPLKADTLGGLFKGVGGLASYMVVRIEPKQLISELFGWMPGSMWEFINRHFQPTSVTPPVVRPAQPQPA